MLLHSWIFTSHTEKYLFQDVPRIPRSLLRIPFSYLPAAAVAVSGPLTLLPQMRRMCVRRDTVYPGTLTQHSRPNAVPAEREHNFRTEKCSYQSLIFILWRENTRGEKKKKLSAPESTERWEIFRTHSTSSFHSHHFVFLKTHQLRCAKGSPALRTFTTHFLKYFSHLRS